MNASGKRKHYRKSILDGVMQSAADVQRRLGADDSRKLSLYLDSIRELNYEGITCLLVEQNVALSLKLANRAYVLENSRIVMQGTGAELLNDDRVRHAYLGIAPAADGASHHGG